MKPGIYNITNKEYHSSEGLNRSAISYLIKSPLHFWHKYLSNNNIEEKLQDSLILGCAVHSLILEYDKFNELFSIIPSCLDRRTKDGKEKFLEIQLKSNDKILLKEELFLIAKEIKNSIIKNTFISEIINESEIEKSIFWIDKESNVLCKSKPDLFTENLMIDIKTSSCASLKYFKRSIFEYNYHIQAAMQLDAYESLGNKKHNNFIFIVVEKDPPYATATYTISDKIIEKGRYEYKSALLKYNDCISNNKWHSYTDSIIEIDI